MHISGIKQSKFLTRADVGAGVLVTIKELYQDNVAKEGAPEEMKFCLAFNELEKPMVLNNTNAQIIAQILKSEETNDWPNGKLVLYDDPNVSFGGKLVGGIRVRAPRGAAARLAQTQPAPAATQPARGPMGKIQNAEPNPPPPVETYNPGDDDVPF